MKLAMLVVSKILLLLMATNVEAHPGHKPLKLADVPMPPPSPPPPSPSTPMPAPAPPSPSPGAAPMPPPAPHSAMNTCWKPLLVQPDQRNPKQPNTTRQLYNPIPLRLTPIFT